MIWSGRITGAPPSMKNGRRIVRNPRSGSPMLVKSAEALEWARQAVQELGPQRPVEPIATDVAMYAQITYRDRRPDLCIALLMDVLEDAGIVKNDRLIRRVIADALVDRECQGVAVVLAPLGEAVDAATLFATLSAPGRVERQDRIGRAARDARRAA